jgi:hypothetical protein
MMMKTNHFDERQIQIRGQVFCHGFVAALALILFNSFLQDNGILWAEPFAQNLIIAMAAITVVSIEFIMRGVYFGLQKKPLVQMVVFGILSVILAGFTVKNLAQGVAFAENHALTENGATLVVGGMFIAITLIALMRVLIERKRTRERDI